MVLGIFYFDFNDLGNDVHCDLGIPRSGFTGYQQAADIPAFQYIPGDRLDEYIP
jgi:hypothetical protein